MYASSAAPPAIYSHVPPGFTSGVNRLGGVHYRDDFYALDHRHGRVALEEALNLHPEFLDRLGDGLTQETMRQAAYLDIETGGESTSHAFLIGVGTFDGLGFRVRQFFLAEPTAEAAMLVALSETLERCQVIVTYNGKAFDLPQLATRYAWAGLSSEALELPHVDLLHVARRLYAGKLSSCRLADIEQRLLKFKRRDDVPSKAIPDLYAAYLRRANPRGLYGVFEHNTLDVLSLPAALAYLGRAAGEFVETTPERHLTLARWDESRGRLDSAVEHYRHAWHLDPDAVTGSEAAWRLARLYSRIGERERCETLWQDERARTSSPTRKVRALVELARLKERTDKEEALRTYAEALGVVQQASPRMFVRTLPRLEQRIERLRARLRR